MLQRTYCTHCSGSVSGINPVFLKSCYLPEELQTARLDSGGPERELARVDSPGPGLSPPGSAAQKPGPAADSPQTVHPSSLLT